jgi:hypothetical protein
MLNYNLLRPLVGPGGGPGQASQETAHSEGGPPPSLHLRQVQPQETQVRYTDRSRIRSVVDECSATFYSRSDSVSHFCNNLTCSTYVGILLVNNGTSYNFSAKTVPLFIWKRWQGAEEAQGPRGLSGG